MADRRLAVRFGGASRFVRNERVPPGETPLDPVHIDRASTLVTSGVYRVTRNPMYLGLTVLLLAWAVFLAAPWTLLGPVVFALFISRFQIAPEEHAMREKFGVQYEAYAARVRRWL